MAAKKNITIAQAKAALKRNHGSILLAARSLKITYQSLHERVGKHADLQTFIREIDASLIAQARSNVAEALAKKDKTTSRWYLEKRDKEFAPKLETSLSEDSLAAIVAAFGGSVDGLRSLRRAIDPTTP